MTEIKDKQKTRIAGAFEKHFRHFGFKKTTVDEVATEIGVSKKTIYQHFRSKDEIFSYIIARKAAARRVHVEEEIRHLSSAKAKMDAMIKINFDEFRKIHKKRAKAMDDYSRAEIASRIFRKTFFSLVSDIVKEGVDNKEFEVCDQELSVRYIQALITETILMAREDADERPEEMLIQALNKLLTKSN